MLGLTKRVTDHQEWRAMKTFLLLFLAVFVVTILPYLLFNIAALSGSLVSALVQKLGSGIISLITITDPIIIMRNADVKESFNDFCSKTLKRNKFTEADANNQERSMELATAQ